MKKPTYIFIIGLIAISLITTSSTCKAPDYGGNIIGTWDYRALTRDIDDSINHSNGSVYDTSFTRHSQNSYQFEMNDSVIYTDYTVHPAVAKYGTYQLINCTNASQSGKIALSFPPAGPDTLSYTSNGEEIQLQLYTITASSHISTFTTYYYLPY
jgi:hypothetical protein